MSLEALYFFLAAGSLWCLGIEIVAMTKEGLIAIKRKSTRSWSRTAKMMKFGVITWQSISLVLGIVLGKNNYLPLAILAPIGIMYAWHIYLAFRYKKKPFNPFTLQ
jgi:hypothetical protein